MLEGKIKNLQHAYLFRRTKNICEKDFIRSETIARADFVEHKSEQGAKNAGKSRKEGKEYVVKDGDVMHFLFNV